MIPPLERDPRYRLLDVWRGVACLMVVIHHAGFAVIFDRDAGTGSEAAIRRTLVDVLSRMNLGVALFFVISGYCIAASVDATRRRGLSPLAFLGRRVWRIYPPYWAAVLVFLAATAGLDAFGLERLHYGSGRHALQLDSPGSLEAAQWVGNLTLTEEWRPLVWRPPPRKVFTRVAWSLCYEEQFYFVCFLALLAAPARLYGTLALVTAATVLVRVAAADVGWMSHLEGGFPTLWHEFAIGMAVYWRLNVPASRAAKRAVDLGLLAVLIVGINGKMYQPVRYSTRVTALFGLVLIALRDLDDRADSLVWLRPLRACGRRCYSMYLVHLPVCTVGSLWLYERGLTGFWSRALVTVPIVSAASVAASWAFFWAVERHFLNPPIIQRDPGRSALGLAPLSGEADAPALAAARGDRSP